ncbi:DNA-binding transcriptional LysR family regulator [Bradyrhizobium sp. S3.9.1]
MDSLNGIVAFVRAAETLSFVAAGRMLGISASAVGKSVSKLEQSVGTRLFHRTTRRVSLTEEGALFFERCRRILDDLRDAEAMLSQAASTPRGRLRVSLPTIGYRFLLPILPEFRRLYPEIELDLDFSDRIVDLVEEGLDAAIRSGALADSSLMSRRLGPFRFVLCAILSEQPRHAPNAEGPGSTQLPALPLPHVRQAPRLAARQRRGGEPVPPSVRTDLQQHGGPSRSRYRGARHNLYAGFSGEGCHREWGSAYRAR